MILNRFVPTIDPLLCQNQNGIRKGRYTLSQILCLRRIIKEMRIASKVLTMVTRPLTQSIAKSCVKYLLATVSQTR